MVQRLSPDGCKILLTNPDCPLGPPRLLHNGYCVSFPEAKRSGRGVDHPPPSSAEVKERIELYLLLWPFIAWSGVIFYMHVEKNYSLLTYDTVWTDRYITTVQRNTAASIIRAEVCCTLCTMIHTIIVLQKSIFYRNIS